MLEYVFNQPPEPAKRQQAAPGVHWLHFPLPFALDHINLWLLEDGDGWTLVDTGFAAGDTRKIWQAAFQDALEGRPIKRIIVTHYHPDHIGQAGWLAQHFQVPVFMTRGEWAMASEMHAASDADVSDSFEIFFGRHGVPKEQLKALTVRGNTYRKIVPELPPEPQTLAGGDGISINGETWRVHIGLGHAPEHACLYREHDQVLISGDQVLPKISSNLSVNATEPDEDPVTDFIQSLRRIRDAMHSDTLVLPAHGLPFYGLHTRVEQLCDHHRKQLDAAESACRQGPTTAYDILPVLFDRKLDTHQLMFAMGESIAHLNCLLANGRAQREEHQGHLYFTS